MAANSVTSCTKCSPP